MIAGRGATAARYGRFSTLPPLAENFPDLVRGSRRLTQSFQEIRLAWLRSIIFGVVGPYKVLRFPDCLLTSRRSSTASSLQARASSPLSVPGTVVLV